MKNLTIFFILFLLIQLTYSQNCKLNVDKTWGGAKQETLNNAFINSEGNLIVCGSSESSDSCYINKGFNDFYVCEMSLNGTLIRQKTFGGSNIDGLMSGLEASDGNYYFCGYSMSDDGDIQKNYGNRDIVIIKTSKTFNLIWLKVIGGSKADWAFSLTNNENNLYVSGYTLSNDNDFEDLAKGGSDGFLLCMDTASYIKWTKCIGGSKYDEIAKVKYYNNYLYAVGSSSSYDGDVLNNNGMYDVWVLKIDMFGNLVESCNFGGSNDDLGKDFSINGDFISCIAQSGSNDGDVAINKGDADIWVLLFDHNLKLIRSETYGGSFSDYPYSIICTDNNDLLVAGKTNSHDGDTPPPKQDDYPPDAWIMVIDTALKTVVNCRYGNLKSDNLNALCLSENLVYALGTTFLPYHPNPSIFSYDFWLVGLDATSDIPVNEEKDDIRIQLIGKNLIVHSQDHPHGIEYVKVHSVDGKLITVKDGNNSGRVEVPLKGLPKGVYLVEVFTDHRIVKKLCVQE